MNDLTALKVLKGELTICNAVENIYFTSMTKLTKLNNCQLFRSATLQNSEHFFYSLAEASMLIQQIVRQS
jgi:hypothetical protein